VMVTTFMPCSAKFPIIALVAGAFFTHQSWVAPSAYFIGMTAIIFSGISLKKKRLFAGDTAPFIKELPE
ncbi:ferrous iron transport protein B, partial [Enterococcus faecium]|nr:ferrous iron transport protein B [Enterococcus faecium]